MLSDRVRDHILITLWFFVTFRQFPGDELLLYPLALYFSWAFVRDFNLLFPILLRSAIVFAFPIWWLLSAMWGEEPAFIIRSGVQLLLTILICYSATIRLRERDLIISMLIAAGWSGLLSFQISITGNGFAPRGVFRSKNAMGAAMVILWLACLCTMLDPGRQRWLRIVAVVMGLIAIFQIFISYSATAVLLGMGVTLVVVSAGVLPRTGAFQSKAFYSAVTACLGVAFIFAAFFFAFQTVDPATYVLSAFGKDTSLTGRTDLWQYAEQEIAKQPYLGLGAGGFWTPYDGASTARVIYDEFYKSYSATFNFHNSFYEIAVHQGLIGLGLVLLTITWMLMRLLWDCLFRNSIPTIFFVSIGATTLIISLTESSLFQPFNLMTMLFIMGVLLSVKSKPILRHHVQSYESPVKTTQKTKPRQPPLLLLKPV